MLALAIKNKNLRNTTLRKIYLLSLSAECALANKSHTEVCSTVDNDSLEGSASPCHFNALSVNLLMLLFSALRA